MNQNLTQIRHERSLKDFPELTLDEDEYVVTSFGRSRNSLLLSLGGLRNHRRRHEHELYSDCAPDRGRG